MSYDPDNVFAKILRGEIPCKKVYENEYALAFYDIHPLTKIHVLVIPKKPYTTFHEFTATAPDNEITGFFKAVAAVAEKLGVHEDGYRILSNIGKHGHQEVPHLHVHIFGGEQLGARLASSKNKSSH